MDNDIFKHQPVGPLGVYCLKSIFNVRTSVIASGNLLCHEQIAVFLQ